jgi:hypothetical protein
MRWRGTRAHAFVKNCFNSFPRAVQLSIKLKSFAPFALQSVIIAVFREDFTTDGTDDTDGKSIGSL